MKKLFDLSSNQNQRPIEKKFVRLAAKPVLVSQFFLQKQQIYDFLAGKNYPDSPHLQGVWNLPHKFHLYLFNLKCFIYFLSLLDFQSLTCHVWTVSFRESGVDHLAIKRQLSLIVSKIHEFNNKAQSPHCDLGLHQNYRTKYCPLKNPRNCKNPDGKKLRV